MAHNNGIITAPISLVNDIPYVLGISSYDLGTQCTSDRINQDSLIKPIALNKLEELTYSDFLSQDFGYGIETYPNSYDGVVQSRISPKWNYIKPTGGNYPYRATDFDGYNHKAVNPFLFTVENARMDGKGDAVFYFDVASLTKWDKWKAFSGANINKLNFGIIVDHYMFGYHPFTSKFGQTINDLDKFKVPIPNLSYLSNPYKAWLVLTNWDYPTVSSITDWVTIGTGDVSSWWFLPYTCTFNISEQITPIEYISFSENNLHTNIRTDNTDIIFSNTSFTFNISANAGYPFTNGNLIVEFKVDNVYSGIGTSVETKTIGSFSQLFGSGTNITKNINYPQDIRFLTDRDHLTIRTEITLTIGSKQYVQLYNITIFP